MVNIRPEVAGVIVQIIDGAAKAGVFTGQDLSTVGKVREEIVTQLEGLNTPTELKETVAPTTPPSEK